MKPILRIVSFLLVLCLLAGSLAGCASVNKPLTYLKRALEKTIDKRFGGDVWELLSEMINGGSLAFSFEGGGEVESPMDAAELKLWMNAGGKQLFGAGNVTANGKKYDGEMFFTQDELVFSSSALLGSNTVGVRFDTLSDDLENSIFRNNSGTDFANPAVDGETDETLIEWKNALLTLLSSVEDIYKVSDDVAEDFLAILTDHAEYNRYSEKGRIYITATIDNTSLSRALRDTRERAVKSKKFCRELRELAAARDALLSARTGTVVTVWSDKAELFIASGTNMDALCAKIDNMPHFELTVSAKVRRLTRMIETAEVSFVSEGAEKFGFSADLTDKDINVLQLRYGGITRTLTYRVTKDSWRYYNAEFDYTKRQGDTVLYVMRGDLALQKWKDDYTLTLESDGETREISGKCDWKYAELHLSVDEMTVNGRDTDFRATLSVIEEERPPKIPEYVNLFTMSEIRFEPISGKLESGMEELKALWEETDLSARTVFNFLFDALGVDEEIPPPAPK